MQASQPPCAGICLHSATAKAARNAIEEGVDLARQLGDKTSLFELSVLPFLTPTTVRSPGGADGPLASMTAKGLSADIDDDDARGRALSLDVYVSTELGDRERTDRAIEAMSEFGTRRQRLNMQWLGRHASAMAAILDGRFSAAESLAGEARRLGKQTHGVEVEGVYAMQMFAIRREQGRLAEVAPVVKHLIEQESGQGDVAAGLCARRDGSRLSRRCAASARPDGGDRVQNATRRPAQHLALLPCGSRRHPRRHRGGADALRPPARLRGDDHHRRRLDRLLRVGEPVSRDPSGHAGGFLAGLPPFRACTRDGRRQPVATLARARAGRLCGPLLKVGGRAATARAMALSDLAWATATELDMVRLKKKLRPTLH